MQWRNPYIETFLSHNIKIFTGSALKNLKVSRTEVLDSPFLLLFDIVVVEVLCGTCGGGILILRQKILSKQ